MSGINLPKADVTVPWTFRETERHYSTKCSLLQFGDWAVVIWIFVKATYSDLTVKITTALVSFTP